MSIGYQISGLRMKISPSFRVVLMQIVRSCFAMFVKIKEEIMDFAYNVITKIATYLSILDVV